MGFLSTCYDTYGPRWSRSWDVDAVSVFVPVCFRQFLFFLPNMEDGVMPLLFGTLRGLSYHHFYTATALCLACFLSAALPSHEWMSIHGSVNRINEQTVFELLDFGQYILYALISSNVKQEPYKV